MRLYFSIIVRVWSQLCKSCLSVGDIQTYEDEINRVSGYGITQILREYIPKVAP